MIIDAPHQNTTDKMAEAITTESTILDMTESTIPTSTELVQTDQETSSFEGKKIKTTNWSLILS